MQAILPKYKQRSQVRAPCRCSSLKTLHGGVQRSKGLSSPHDHYSNVSVLLLGDPETACVYSRILIFCLDGVEKDGSNHDSTDVKH